MFAPIFTSFSRSVVNEQYSSSFGKAMKLEPDGVVAELAARQPRPFDGVLAFLVNFCPGSLADQI